MEKTSLSLKTEYGDIVIPKSLTATVTAHGEDITSYTYQGSDPNMSIAIQCNDGDITVY